MAVVSFPSSPSEFYKSIKQFFGRYPQDPSLDMDALAARLATLSTDEEKIAAIDLFFDSRDQDQPLSIHQLRPDTLNAEQFPEKEMSDEFAAMLKRLSLEKAYMEHCMRQNPKAEFENLAAKSLKRLPCANVDPNRRFACHQDGTKACSNCSLVCYCCKECQKAHWKLHKQDCKSRLGDPNWLPGWISENRTPSFVNGPGVAGWQNQHMFGQKIILWGNVIATSVLNLPKNEGSDVQQDLALAFIASGDLRNVIKSVNELPDDYKGHLTLLINDHSPFITMRNLVLLFLLGKISDVDKAAELALHVWYSLYLPHPSRLALSAMVQEILKSAGPKFETNFLPGKAKLKCELGEVAMMLLVQTMVAATRMDSPAAANEWAKVMLAPSRVDYRDRYLALLNSSHRVAFHEYRSFGLVLPFGAPNAHFNVPNPFLFAPDGSWLQNDSASPLNSWNVADMVDSGSAHGAKSQDIFGCLYFHLSDQISRFAERIRRFNVTIHLTSIDALDLSQKISSGHFANSGLSASKKFDRVEVSNILDVEYLGVAPVLRAWGKMLNPNNKFSTLLGYLMNWKVDQEDTEEKMMKHVLSEATKKAVAEGWVKKPRTLGEIQRLPYIILGIKEAICPNSTEFRQYLNRHDVEKVARDLGLVLKSKHSINPHRICADIDAGFTGLPQFSDKEDFYRQVHLNGTDFSERYVEFARTK